MTTGIIIATSEIIIGGNQATMCKTIKQRVKFKAAPATVYDLLADSEKHTAVDPLSVRFTDLHRYVTELPEFKGDPQKSTEAKLEAIQMAWHEEFQDRTQA